MSDSLEFAFKQASKLSESEQDVLAAIVLQELEDEARWTKSYASTQGQLAKAASNAVREHRAGSTRRLRI